MSHCIMHLHSLSTEDLTEFVDYLKKSKNPRILNVQVTQGYERPLKGLLVTYKRRTKKIFYLKRALNNIEYAILLADNVLWKIKNE